MSRTRPPRRPSAKKAAAAPPAAGALVATRKGAWLFHGDARRKTWRRRPALPRPHHQPPACSTRATAARCWRRRRPATSARRCSARPTSAAPGRKPREPPAFAKAAGRAAGAASVDHTFWLTPGHASEPDTWYAGTSPQGLFRSEDGGVTWEPFSGVNDDPQYREWMGTRAGRHARRARSCTRSSSTRATRRICTSAMSGGGVHESLDGGADLGAADRRAWRWSRASIADQRHLPRSALRAAVPEQPRPALPAEPLRHLPPRPPVGRRGSASARSMPKQVGDIGFPMVVHPRDADTAWVFPMDGTSVWPRTSPDGKPGGLRHAQRRQELAAPRRRPAREPGLVDGEAPGDDARTRAIRSASTSAPPAASCG